MNFQEYLHNKHPVADDAVSYIVSGSLISTPYWIDLQNGAQFGLIIIGIIIGLIRVVHDITKFWRYLKKK